MNKDDRTVEQRLDRLERLIEEKFAAFDALLLKRQNLPKPEPPDDKHRGSRKVDPKSWYWPEW